MPGPEGSDGPRRLIARTRAEPELAESPSGGASPWGCLRAAIVALLLILGAQAMRSCAIDGGSRSAPSGSPHPAATVAVVPSATPPPATEPPLEHTSPDPGAGQPPAPSAASAAQVATPTASPPADWPSPAGPVAPSSSPAAVFVAASAPGEASSASPPGEATATLPAPSTPAEIASAAAGAPGGSLHIANETCLKLELNLRGPTPRSASVPPNADLHLTVGAGHYELLFEGPRGPDGTPLRQTREVEVTGSSTLTFRVRSSFTLDR